MDVLFAAEHLVPPVGGAETWALELLEDLAPRHRVRAAWLDGGQPAGWRADRLPDGIEGGARPCPVVADEGYWRTKSRRRRALGAAIAEELSRDRPDVVVAQLHGAPAALEAAAAAGVPGVLVMPSYESLCRYAFEAGTDCAPAHDCSSCPAASRLDPDERAAMLESRAAHDEAARAGAAVVAIGPAVAEAFRGWTGREAVALSPVVSHPPAPAEPPAADGPAVLSAARWSENKGAALLADLARALAPRPVRVTEEGLGAHHATLAGLSNVRLGNATAAELLAGAAVLLVPSTWPEPFARVAFEALAAGVPVVAAALGSLPSFVPREGLVQPGAPAAEWRRTVDEVTDRGRWPAASERAKSAAAAVLAGRPIERMERLLSQVAQA